MRLSFQQVKKKIQSMVPSNIDYDVDLEAASIAIVTNTPEAFSGSDSLASKIAKAIKRRIEIRPSASIMMSACLLYTSPSPRDISGSRMPSSA